VGKRMICSSISTSQKPLRYENNMACGSCKKNVSEELIAFIIRARIFSELRINLAGTNNRLILFIVIMGGSTFLRNVSSYKSLT
jgi:hypothetical protein